MRKLFKNVSIYSLGGTINKSIQFLLLPLYTRVISPTDYGKLELVYLLGSILTIINGLLVQNAYVRLYFDPSYEKKYQGELFSTTLLFITFCSIITFLLCFRFSGFIADNIFNFENGSKYVKLIAISSILVAIGNLPEKTLIIQQKAKLFVVLNIIHVLVTICFTIYFVLFLNLNIDGVLWAQIIGFSLRFVLMFFVTFNIIRKSFSFRMIRSLLAFSVFLIPTQLSSFIAYLSNRLFLQEFKSLDDVGLFSLAYKIASVIPILLTEPVKMAFGPHIYSRIDEPERCRDDLKHFTRLFVIFLTGFAFLLSLYSKELIMMMSDQSYHASYKLVFPLSLSYIFIGVAGIVVTAINITKKTWIITIAWIIGSIINLLCNYLLIPSFGSFGASIATIMTFFIILVIYFFFVEKYFMTGFQYFLYFKIILLSIIIYAVSELFAFSWQGILLMKLLLTFIFFILLTRIALINSEKEFLMNLMKLKNSRRMVGYIIGLKPE